MINKESDIQGNEIIAIGSPNSEARTESKGVRIKAICMNCLLETFCFNLPDIGWVCPSCLDYEAERND